MKINSLKINSFGKLNNKEMGLTDGINIIVGKNEAGKSTIAKFIPSIFYGISKNKNSKDISDFDKYYPWNSDEYSGKICYELDDGKKYEVYRDFKKKNPVIYNEFKEDISKDFLMDKSRNNTFFTEQIKVDEYTFLNTAICNQEATKLEKASQNVIIQKISNIVLSGDEETSYKKIIDKINKKQNEDIGTNRTIQKPLNIINSKIANLQHIKSELEKYKEQRSIGLDKLEEKKYELILENKKIEFLKDLKNLIEDNKLAEAEIKFSKNIEDKYSKKINDIETALKEPNESNSSLNYRKYFVIYIVLMILFATVVLLNLNKFIIVPLAILLLVTTIELLWKKHNNNNNNEEKSETEIEIIFSNLENQKIERENKEQAFLERIKQENINITRKYIDDIDLKYIEKFLNKDSNELQKELSIVEKNIENLRFKTNIMERDALEITNKLNELSKIEEELYDLQNEKVELNKLNNSYNIAKECLEKAYLNVKKDVTPKLKNNLNNIVSYISNGKYSKLSLIEDGLNVEVENGEYMPISRLSIGTIDQIYLSLRMSILSEISREKIPLILDETFAYFDDERLLNILKYLYYEYKGHQILIFTCSGREIECLNRLNIEYNLINLEK